MEKKLQAKVPELQIQDPKLQKTSQDNAQLLIRNMDVQRMSYAAYYRWNGRGYHVILNSVF